MIDLETADSGERGTAPANPDPAVDDRRSSWGRRLLPALIGWTLVWLFFSQRLFHAYQISDYPISWGQALRWSFLDWSLWAAMSPLVFRAARRWRLVRGNRLANVVKHLLFGVLLAFAHFVINLGAGAGAFAMGYLDDVLGGKRTVQVSLIGLFCASLLAVLGINDLAVCTSGNYERGFTFKGKRYSRSNRQDVGNNRRRLGPCL